jgi:hypothetical protein
VRGGTRLLLGSLAAALLAGCGGAAQAPIGCAGVHARAFAPGETFLAYPGVGVGMTRTQLCGLLGAPSSVTVAARGHQTWRYSGSTYVLVDGTVRSESDEPAPRAFATALAVMLRRPTLDAAAAATARLAALGVARADHSVRAVGASRCSRLPGRGRFRCGVAITERARHGRALRKTWRFDVSCSRRRCAVHGI